jgi:hypothetical protein
MSREPVPLANEKPELCQEGRYAGAMNEVTQKGQQEADMS